MRRTLRVLLCFLFSLLWQGNSLQAQGGVPFDAPIWQVLEDSSRNLLPAAVWEQYRAGKFSSLQKPALEAGFTSSVFWLAIPTKQLPVDQELQLVVNNAHINRLDWYSVYRDTIILKLVSGDFYPFKQRYLDYNVFTFPLLKGPECYLLKIDKHHESLNVGFLLQTKDELLAIASREAMVNGVLTGIVLLIVLFGVFLFATTKDRVYLWYSLYVLMVLLWIWADKGLGFHYIWPGSTYFPSRSRPLFSVLNIIASIQFLQAFTQMNNKSWHYKVLHVVKWVMGAMAMLVLLPIPYQQLNMQTMIFLRVLASISFTAIIVVLVYLVQRTMAKSREAKVYLMAISVFSFCALTESLYHMGFAVLPAYLEQYSMFIGIVLEMIIITFGLASRFNSYRKDRELLLMQMNAQQKQLTDTIIEVQENERKTLADQLHDELGSMLSLAALNISALPVDEKTTQATHVLQLVTHTVRNMSHQLTPVAIEKYGFRHAVEDLVRMANTSGKLSVEVVLIGFEQRQAYAVNFHNTLYRIIQELLQNVIKHASASHALVQVIEHDDTVALLVEDNGRGIDDQEKARPGTIFLRSIRSKIDYLEGKMSLESAEAGGTMVNIEIPLPKKSISV